MRKAFLIAAVLFAASASADQELLTYPGTSHIRIGNDLVIAGEYYRIGYFRTKDSIETVADHFFRLMKRQGYPVTLDRNGKDEITVSALYTREGLLRSIVLVRQPERTLGFTVLKDLWVTAPKVERPELLKLEGQFFAHNTGARDETGASVARTVAIEGREMAQVRTEVVDKLQAQGFSVEREAATDIEGGKQRHLEFRRGFDQVSVVISGHPDKTITVQETVVSSSRPDAFPTSDVKRDKPATGKEPKK